jgi:hypothetical protein
MPTLFHIIDATTEDVEGDTPVGYISDEDPEVRRLRSKKQESNIKSPDKLRVNMYLFGKTAAGQPLRACI